MKKEKEPIISTVIFNHIGTEKDFNNFLKSVVHDYFDFENMKPYNPKNIVQKVENNKD